MRRQAEQDVDLYRVYLNNDAAHTGINDHPVYLGNGVPLDEAERLSKALAADTYVKQVYWAVDDE